MKKKPTPEEQQAFDEAMMEHVKAGITPDIPWIKLTPEQKAVVKRTIITIRPSFANTKTDMRKVDDDELISRYRNLMISIARDAAILGKEVVTMRAVINGMHPNHPKRVGMHTQINARNRQRARLLQLLGRNNPSLRHFFGTTRPDKVAAQEIKLSTDSS